MKVAMFALAGMPPLVGFLGKLFLFSTVIESGFLGIAIIDAINSVISLYYYLRVVVALYFKEPSIEVAVERDLDQGEITSNIFPAFAVFSATAAVVFIGIYSQPLISAVDKVFK